MDWYPVKPIAGGKPLGGLFRRLLADPNWVCEAKMDGKRAIWDGQILWSRTGNRLPQALAVLAAVTGHPPIDGELVKGVLWAFDLPDHPGSLDERRVALAALVQSINSDAVRLLPRCSVWTEVEEQGWEGVVFKRRDSQYEKATVTSKTSPSWVKFRKEWL